VAFDRLSVRSGQAYHHGGTDYPYESGFGYLVIVQKEALVKEHNIPIYNNHYDTEN